MQGVRNPQSKSKRNNMSVRSQSPSACCGCLSDGKQRVSCASQEGSTSQSKDAMVDMQTLGIRLGKKV